MIKIAKKLACVLLPVSLLLCACQENPEKSSVVSKNDGAFDANVTATAGEHHEPGETTVVRHTDQFTSTDGSVTFLMDIDEEVTMVDMPVVKVKPHFLTEEDARRAAIALFGDVTFYEAEPARSYIYSKSEIQEKIQRWSPYTTQEALRELYGYDPPDYTAGLVKDFIEEFTQRYELAPEESPHVPCQWTFRKGSVYMLPPDELKEADTSDDNDEIDCQLRLNGIPYLFMVSNRDRSDFKVNMISACVDDGISPSGVDNQIFRARLFRTPEPTGEQLAAIRAQAEQILEDMALGEWKIDRCYVETLYMGEIPEYVVHVDAVPVLNGVEVVRQEQLTSLRGEDRYSSSYYYTDVNFEFAATGELYYFMMYSPLDVQEAVNSNVAVMSFDQLLENAKEYLRNSDAYAYGFGLFLNMVQEPVSCTVTVSQLKYNLIRIRVPNSDDDYCYVPGITLQGTVQYVGESGKVYYETLEPENLVAINGVDGSAITGD